MRRWLPLVALSIILLPTALISRNHHIYFDTALTRNIAWLGLTPWEHKILGATSTYHAQFIALATIISILATIASMCQLIFFRQSGIRNIGNFRASAPNRKSIIPYYDEDRWKVIWQWSLFVVSVYMMRLISVYLMSFDNPSNKEMGPLLSPEGFVAFTTATLVFTSMVVGRVFVDFPIDVVVDQR